MSDPQPNYGASSTTPTVPSLYSPSKRTAEISITEASLSAHKKSKPALVLGGNSFASLKLGYRHVQDLLKEAPLFETIRRSDTRYKGIVDVLDDIIRLMPDEKDYMQACTGGTDMESVFGRIIGYYVSADRNGGRPVHAVLKTGLATHPFSPKQILYGTKLRELKGKMAMESTWTENDFIEAIFPEKVKTNMNTIPLIEKASPLLVQIPQWRGFPLEDGSVGISIESDVPHQLVEELEHVTHQDAFFRVCGPGLRNVYNNISFPNMKLPTNSVDRKALEEALRPWIGMPNIRRLWYCDGCLVLLLYGNPTWKTSHIPSTFDIIGTDGGVYRLDVICVYGTEANLCGSYVSIRGDHVEDGTIGAFLTQNGQLHGITCAHIFFSDHERNDTSLDDGVYNNMLKQSWTQDDGDDVYKRSALHQDDLFFPTQIATVQRVWIRSNKEISMDNDLALVCFDTSYILDKDFLCRKGLYEYSQAEKMVPDHKNTRKCFRVGHMHRDRHYSFGAELWAWEIQVRDQETNVEISTMHTKKESNPSATLFFTLSNNNVVGVYTSGYLSITIDQAGIFGENSACHQHLKRDWANKGDSGSFIWQWDDEILLCHGMLIRKYIVPDGNNMPQNLYMGMTKDAIVDTVGGDLEECIAWMSTNLTSCKNEDSDSSVESTH